MASVTTRRNRSRFTIFIDGDGRPQTIYLGRVPMRYAESVKVKVEDLVSASIMGHAPADETSPWLADLDDRMIDKLARVGLTVPRQTLTLQGWLTQYLDGREGELKPESHRKLGQTRDKLVAYFDPQIRLRTITTQQAAEWRQWLRRQKLSEAAVKTHSGNAKTVMQEAVRRKLLPENPFQHLKSGPTPSWYTRYITPDEITRIIDACPDAEWRLLFGLARYAGLRIPSESHLLTWADVDWERGRLTVRSPKTEHHAGHEQRLVPIIPKLMKLLQDRFDECEEGEQNLVTIRGQGRIMRQVRAICARAGVELWARLWQTLRASCEKEWAMTFPQYAVSKWIGHSITVSGLHYANDVPDELFQQAAAVGGGEAQRKAQQEAHETTRNAPKEKTATSSADARNPLDCENLRESSTIFQNGTNWRRGESNPRPVTLWPRFLRA